MSTTNKTLKPKFGYQFNSPDCNHNPGLSRLDINISKYPTEQHFDPEKLTLDVNSEVSFIESLTIRHPWDFKPTYQALAGSVEMTDRKGKKEEAYTFGGSLNIESFDGFTICTLESPAPILEISMANHLSMMFIEEIEILLAKRKAALLSKPHTYQQRLAKADPFILYIACLNALIDHFEHAHHQENLLISDFLNFLHVERKRIKDEGPALLFVPELENIL